MFPLTKHSQLITNPLHQALTATGRTGSTMLHMNKLTSACFQFQAPREGSALVLTSPQSQGCSFSNPARQRINKAAMLPVLCLLSLPIIYLAFSFLSSSSRVPVYPWIRCFVNTSGRDCAMLSILVLIVGEDGTQASNMLDKNPAAEPHPSPMLCFLWIPSCIGYLAISFNTLLDTHTHTHTRA